MNKYNFKSIIEIPNKNHIVSLVLDSNMSKNTFLIYGFKIIFDNCNIIKSKIITNQNLKYIDNRNNSNLWEYDDYINYRDNSISKYSNNNSINNNTINDNDGILFVYQKFKNNQYNHEESYYAYLKIDKFEIQNIYPIFNVIENSYIYETAYFFVLGIKGNTQNIKLYRIHYDIFKQLELKYKTDVITGINGEIENIQQLTTGSLHISYSNGKTYIYSCPYLKYQEYLEEQDKILFYFGFGIEEEEKLSNFYY